MSNWEKAMPMEHVLLLTGAPGVGKTTILRQVAASLTGWRVCGFSTEEIRVRGQRQGFRLMTFDGREGVLAHIDFRTPHRVGKYGVDVAGFEALVEPALALDNDAGVYLIDEIGKMECLSAKFIAAVRALLDSNRRVVATVAKKGRGFIAGVKQREDVELWEVTHENRTRRAREVLAWLGRL